MLELRDLFRRYTGFLRSLKLVYVLNNLLHWKHLWRNRPLYRRLGLKKSVFAPIGSQDFPQPAGPPPWLDRPDALQALRRHPEFLTFDAALQKQLEQFVQQGYLILRGFHPADKVDALNAEIERLLREKRTGFNYTGRKIMDAFRFSPLLDREFFRNPELLRILEFIMGRPIIPFQTINFLVGSEQRAHSDSIHMTTEPKGYLIAAWTALEDVNEDNGTIFFYPGSHRLPYVLAPDYPTGNTRWRIGKDNYRNYEDAIEQLIRERNLQPVPFLGRKGDVFIWHANLLHGGGPIRRKGATRKSMVAHYFCEGVLCYHEVSQRPAILVRS